MCEEAWPMSPGPRGGRQGLETQGKMSGSSLLLHPPQSGTQRNFGDAEGRRLATRLLRNIYAEVCVHPSKLKPRQ